jgi:HD-GYP domain-containing protein (c-di-GMP phosphodiesterase class II)
LTGDLRAAELVASEEAFLGSHVRALTVALATKDTYTEKHTRRVAMLAVRVGEELGLPSGRLRALAVGALLRDIGKLSIPDQITEEAGQPHRARVRRRPGASRPRTPAAPRARRVGDDVLRLVHDHHERLDGSGYPCGLRGEEICFDARLLAVCDVFDALRSKRVYREAWTHERAIAFLRAGAGTHFEPRCVDALERVLARERNADLALAV